MGKKQFWSLVEAAKRKSDGDCDNQARILEKQLAALPVEDILVFDQLLVELLGLSYKKELWAATYIINGGCSDDGFYYFRAWLIAQGEVVFNNALNDPQTLITADLEPDEDAECEALLYVAMNAYKTKTGSEMPFRERPRIKLTGNDWAEDELETMYPKLYAKFG